MQCFEACDLRMKSKLATQGVKKISYDEIFYHLFDKTFLIKLGLKIQGQIKLAVCNLQNLMKDKINEVIDSSRKYLRNEILRAYENAVLVVLTTDK